MPEPSIHVSVMFALLTHMGFDLPTCVALAATALLPDLDVLVRTHRSVTHSLVAYLPVVLVAMLLYSVAPGFSIILFGVWMSLSSHVLLDVIGGYCPALWPILKEDLMVSAGLQLVRTLVCPRAIRQGQQKAAECPRLSGLTHLS